MVFLFYGFEYYRYMFGIYFLINSLANQEDKIEIR